MYVRVYASVCACLCMCVCVYVYMCGWVFFLCRKSTNYLYFDNEIMVKNKQSFTTLIVVLSFILPLF